MSTSSDYPTITVPAGVTIGPGRETSRVNRANQVQQGINFPLTLEDGTEFSVFLPYAELTNTAAAEATINARIAAVRAISNATS